MGKGRVSHWWTSVFTVISILVCVAFSAQAYDKVSDNKGEIRSDIIKIDTIKKERPAVVFLHDKHSDAMKKENQDCSKCHLSTKGKMSQKFMRTEKKSSKDLMDLYHDNCITCHKEQNAKKGLNKIVTPVACAECHKEKAAVVSARKPLDFDKSLHARHEKAQKGECLSCHHIYDTKKEKTVYAKGKESSCRYCHKEDSAKVGKPVKSDLKTASHNACISCHIEKGKIDPKMTGPVSCAACHDEVNQKKIKKLSVIPRMKRNQPDATLIRTGKKVIKNKMDYVLFDHKAHEKNNQSCLVCHHKALDKCSSCHTVEGKKEGSFVTLDQAMHKKTADQSCIGCHNQKKEEKTCAGCHELLGRTKKVSNQSCKLCHTEKAAKLTKEASMRLLSSRNYNNKIYKAADIPDVIEIKQLKDKYGSVKFPHKQIIQALYKGVKNNKLTGYFHKDPGTLCQGCHHNAPVTAKPTGCISCHDLKKSANSDRPSLVGAYHNQCMGCHKTMGIKLVKKTESCTECHKKR